MCWKRKSAVRHEANQVFRPEPFRAAGIEVDVMIDAMCLYNYFNLRPTAGRRRRKISIHRPAAFDGRALLGNRRHGPVITSGYRDGARCVPLGGNHFTKALTRTEAHLRQAEHLKRSAGRPDPRPCSICARVQRSSHQCSVPSATSPPSTATGRTHGWPGQHHDCRASGAYLSQSRDSRWNAWIRSTTWPASAPPRPSKGVSLRRVLRPGGASGGQGAALLLPGLVDRIIRGKEPWAVAAAAASSGLHHPSPATRGPTGAVTKMFASASSREAVQKRPISGPVRQHENWVR